MLQVRNTEHSMIQRPDLLPNQYVAMHEPIGGIGVWNGQFEQASYASPVGAEGWELVPDAGGILQRVTGGLGAIAGNWYMSGGRAGVGTGGILRQTRYMPVDEGRDYNIYCAAASNNVAATMNFGCYCYTAAKVFIAAVNTLAAVAPGLAWTRNVNTIGPLGVAWPANTRYARVYAHLQTNAALAAAYVYIDDISFWFWNM